MAGPPGFLFSGFVAPGHAAITLRGDIDAATAGRLAEHLDGLLDTTPRLITIDATAVRSCHPRVLDLFGETRRRVAARGGMISVVGLHPNALPTPAPAFPPTVLVPDSPPAPAADPDHQRPGSAP